MQTSNQSVKFNSERGNDIYLQRNKIIIPVSAESAPLINTSDSYLMFSCLMGNDKTGEASANYFIPEPKIGCMPFESCTVRSPDGVVLEQLSSMQIWEAMKNYYGNNINDEHLQAVYHGRSQLYNKEYVSDNLVVPTADGSRAWAITTAGSRIVPNLGGGFKSQYYTFSNEMIEDNSRKAQIIYRFPMSGLLSSLRSEVLTNIALGGIVIELILSENSKFLRVQKLLSNNGQEIGYGVTKKTTTGNSFDDSTGLQGFVGGDDQTYAPTFTCYGFQGYYTTDAGGVDTEHIADIPDNGASITGIILQNSADAGDKFNIDDIENCSIKVGSKIRIGYDLDASATLTVENCTASLIDSVVTKISKINGRIHIRFNAFQTQTTVANATTGKVTQGNPVFCSLSSSGTPTFVDGNADSGKNSSTQISINKGRYELSNVEYIASVVNTDSGYLNTLVKQTQNSTLKIQYNTYRDIRINIPREALSNEMNIPSDLQECFSVLGVTEILQSQSALIDSVSPSFENLDSYVFIIDGIRVPNQEVDLKRISQAKVNAIHMIETEKALLESSIPVKSLLNPHKFVVIGRRLGNEGSSISLLDKNIKCRVNYTGQQPLSLQYHFFIYHTSAITFNNGQISVVS